MEDTGDLGRWGAGVLEIAGIKLRGFDGDGEVMYGAVADQSRDSIFVLSAGRTYTVNGTTYGGLRIYTKHPTNNSYTLLQLL